LLRALSDWVGVPGHVTEAAFRIGDNLLSAMRVPLYRRVSVYNHKHIAAANSTHDEPAYDVNSLTRSIFSVTHWHEIAKISDPQLNVNAGPLKNADVVLREAYYTKLNMRLSTGITLNNYNED